MISKATTFQPITERKIIVSPHSNVHSRVYMLKKKKKTITIDV